MPAQSFDVSATVRQLPSRCAKVQDAPLQTPSMAAEATALPPSPFAAYSGADSIQSSGTEKRRTPDRSEGKAITSPAACAATLDQSRQTITESPELTTGPWPGNKYSCCESSVEEPGQIVSEAAKEQHVASAAAATAAQVPAEFEGAPLPANEAERMEMVHCMQVLDSPEDPVLNSLCTLLCSILKVPLAGPNGRACCLSCKRPHSTSVLFTRPASSWPLCCTWICHLDLWDASACPKLLAPTALWCPPELRAAPDPAAAEGGHRWNSSHVFSGSPKRNPLSAGPSCRCVHR